MKKPINLSNDSNEIKQVANGRLCCAIHCRRFTVLMDGLIIRESMCNPSCYAVLQGAKKLTNYSTGAPKTPRIVFLLRWWPGGADRMYVKPIFYSHGQAQHVVNGGLFLNSEKLFSC